MDKRKVLIIGLFVLFAVNTAHIFVIVDQIPTPHLVMSSRSAPKTTPNPPSRTPPDSPGMTPAQPSPLPKTPPHAVEKTNTRTFGNVHTFYYGWYGNPETNLHWMHWNHRILPDWRDKNPPPPQYLQPPEDIGSNFYPLLGPYSSAANNTLHEHAKQMASAGIGHAVVSWYPLSHSDAQIGEQPGYSDSLMHLMLEIFPQYNVQVSIHIEPYEGRNALSVKGDIRYIIDNYSGPGLFKDESGRPMIFVYDSYHTPATEWATIFSPSGAHSVRNTPYDVTAIGLYLERKDQTFFTQGKWDGFYTYFGATGFTQGSTLAQWPSLASFAKSNNLLFVPSVAPGYEDTRIRPWNAENSRPRENGAYYDRMWKAAIECNPPHIGVTSFNEWHEGTQIEPARENQSPEHAKHYFDYSPLSPSYYLDRTLHWAQLYNNQK